MGRRDFGAAVSAYEQALAIDPNNAIAIGGLGLALQKVGRYSESAALLERALPPLNSDSAIPEELALAYIATGQEDRADALLGRNYPANVAASIKETIRIRLKRLPPPE